MKKLFRFKYEPCNGTCYAPEIIFFEEMKKITQDDKIKLTKKIVKAHDQLCDNSDYSFGLDMCEKTNLFIGHFRQPERLDLFTGNTLSECIDDMTNYIIQTNIPKMEGLCVYGDNGPENLAEQILKQTK